MKSYLISTVTDFIDAPIALVYSIVTDNSNFQWREEVKDIELLEEGFIEYYKAGGHTLFSNIRKIENEYYAFTMQHRLFWNLKRIQQNYIKALKVKVYANK